jgi:hypothetical protein
MEFYDFYHMREFIIPLTMVLLFFLFFQENLGYSIISERVRGVGEIIIFFALFQSIFGVLFLLDRQYGNFFGVFRMHDFGSNYWRFVGFWGNPNFTSFSILLGMFFLLLSDHSKSIKIIFLTFILLGLFSTGSRTGFIIAILLFVVYFFLNKSRSYVFFIFVFCIFVLNSLNIDFDSAYYGRIKSMFDYFNNDRPSLAIEWISYLSYNIFEFLFGLFRVTESNYFDNDFLFFWCKFGLNGFISIILLLSIGVKNYFDLRRKQMHYLSHVCLCMFFLYFIICLTAAAFSYPKLLFIYFLIQIPIFLTSNNVECFKLMSK